MTSNNEDYGRKVQRLSCPSQRGARGDRLEDLQAEKFVQLQSAPHLLNHQQCISNSALGHLQHPRIKQHPQFTKHFLGIYSLFTWPLVNLTSKLLKGCSSGEDNLVTVKGSHLIRIERMRAAEKTLLLLKSRSPHVHGSDPILKDKDCGTASPHWEI